MAVSNASSAFPSYLDGDALLVLSPTRQYQLHAGTLCRQSSYFKQQLTEETGAHQTLKARKEGSVVRWRFDLILPISEQEGVGRFCQRIIDQHGRVKGQAAFPDVENAKSPPAIFGFYDNVFRAYYSQPLIFNDENISLVLYDVIGLVKVAEELGSLRAISPSADNALIKQGQVLFRSIASNPVAWADLANRIHSELIFKEAVIHMVGQWKTIAKDDNIDMDPVIRTVCQRKYDDLHQMKSAIELRILGYYPPHVQRASAPTSNPAATGRGRGGRGGSATTLATRQQYYASDIMAWMAIALYRHWLGQHVCGGLSKDSTDGGYTFYHAIHTAGRESYLDREAVDSFCGYFPMSWKSRAALDTQICLLKTGLRPYVRNLVENKSMLDVLKYPLKYLTCVDVQKKDMPWISEGDRGSREISMGSDGVTGVAPAATDAIAERGWLTTENQAHWEYNEGADREMTDVGYGADDEMLFLDNEQDEDNEGRMKSANGLDEV